MSGFLSFNRLVDSTPASLKKKLKMTFLFKRFLPLIAISTLLPSALADEVISFDLVRTSAGTLEARMPYESSNSVRVGDRLELSSDDGYEFGLEISKTSYSELGNRIIHATTDAGGKALLVVGKDGELIGSITEMGERHQISTSADGQRQITKEGYSGYEKKIDDGGLAPKAQIPEQIIDLELDELEVGYSQAPIMNAEPSSDVIYPTYKTGTAKISVLMYYDDSMSNPLSAIDFITQVANDVYADSGASIQIDIVGTKSLDIDDEASHYDLKSAMSVGEAPFEEIESDRRFFEADLVYLLRETEAPDGEDPCGIASYGVYKQRHWSASYTGLVQWAPRNGGGAYCSDLSFAHELGHNLGAAHNREDLTDEGELKYGAYSYSYGRTVPSRWRTVMGYVIDGYEPYVALFSSPDLTCQGDPCGKPASSADSADNVSTFHSTGHLIASNEGPFAYEAVSTYASRKGESACTTSDDEAGFWTGVVLRNQSPLPVELVSTHFKRSNGSYVVYEHDADERVAQPESITGAGFCRAEEDAPIFGTTYTEGFMRYRHPETGAIVETETHEAASDFDGEYRQVRVALGQGGSVSGNPSRSARLGSSQTFTFTPESGYELSGIQSNCSGRRSGNSYTVDVDQDNCFVEATFQAVAQEATLRLSIEGPKTGESYSGIGTLRGWAVAEEGIDYVEIYIDGAFYQNAPYGGRRGDVGNIFPEIEGSKDSGFALAFNYNNLSVGNHTLKAVAVTDNGRQLEQTSQFSVTKFHKNYIRPSDNVDLNSAVCSVQDDEISVIDALIDGRVYDISMKWRSSDQGFEIYEIR